MNPEDRELLRRVAKLAEDNNDILRSMRRGARLASLARFVYWAAIIIAGLAAYYFIQPYFSAVLNGYSEIQKSIKGVNNTTSKLNDLTSVSLPSWLTGKK